MSESIFVQGLFKGVVYLYRAKISVYIHNEGLELAFVCSISKSVSDKISVIFVLPQG